MLAQLATVHESIEAGGGAVIGLAPAAAYQAQILMDESIPFRLFIDGRQLVIERLGVTKQSLPHFVFSVAAWWRYAKAFFAGHFQRRITGHYSNVPAVCVVDAQGDATYVYRGKGIGDYPTLEQVLDELAKVTH